MQNNFLHSPVRGQSFIWTASYADGTFLDEFDRASGIENNFNRIDRRKLIRFGLVGHGMNLYYEVFGGVFKAAGQMIEFFIKDKATQKQYFLTGQQLMYNDIIQYKHAEASFNPSGQAGDMNSQITQYNFGYKSNLKIDEINFNFKAILSLPYNKPAYFNLRLVSDNHIDGIFCIRLHGIEVVEFDAPIEANIASEINWRVTI
ncbi:hypothetical protein K0T92_04950 [Paenibacillus oenotherae]|uniref:Uncharacterized protein n=1 Tax=Paenibacillus oenotherae TaxID=1435645 RepID=A0ABS7D3N7_9BACL|nr:hypothetical protein [Paenibacillus oenotherae]MBW7474081.1 hypothetical protein [Paenibacillus oenotherae]